MSEDENVPQDQCDSPLIRPIYWQTTPNETISFGKFDAMVTHGVDQATEVASGEARLRFTPKESLEIVFPVASELGAWDAFSRIMSRSSTTSKLHIPELRTTFDMFLKSTRENSMVYTPTQTPLMIGDDVKNIRKSAFHLVNWPLIRGTDNYKVTVPNYPYPDGYQIFGKVMLEVDSWIITIAEVEGTGDAVKSVRESGGYSITYVGSVERDGHKEYTSSDLSTLLSDLSYLFAFVFGEWRSPCLAVAFDANDSHVYKEWGLRQVDSERGAGVCSWFDEHHSEMIPQVLPGFWRLLKSDVWAKPWTNAIYWYIKANQGGAGLGVDSAILFSQAALELLSWTYCVLDRKMVSESAFRGRGLSASDKIRILVSSLGLPLHIPQNLTRLHSKPGKKWADSMDVITDIRNRLVHPGGERDFPDGAYFEAWKLSMWYLELILLRLCQYSGRYSNRLSQRWVGEVEPVPWNVS